MTSKNIGQILFHAARRGMVAMTIVVVALVFGALITNLPPISQERQHEITRLLDQKGSLERAGKILDEAYSNAQAGVNKTEADLQQAREAVKRAKEAAAKAGWYVAWLTKWGKDWDKFVAEENAKKQAAAEAEKQEKRASILASQARDTLNQIRAEQAGSAAQLGNVLVELKKVSKLELLEATFFALLWKWKWAILSFIIFFITPAATWLRRTFVWFGPGLLIERWTKPIVFPVGPLDQQAISIGPNQVSVELALSPDEEGWFRNEYLDRTTRPKGTRFPLVGIFSKKYWLMSLLDGLWWMTKLQTDGTNGTSVKVSDPVDPVVEFSVVEIPENSSLILHPSHIVGITFPKAFPPRINRYWRLTQVQSWVSGQVIFFEMLGPMRIVLRGARGIQTNEVLDNPCLETRLNPGSLVGFSPQLSFFVRRSESFWQYIASDQPVFDYSFSGKGLFICEETQQSGRKGGVLGWFAGIGDALFKLAGF